MHLISHVLFLSASTTTTTSSTTSSSGSSVFLIVIIALVAAFYFLLIRPNQKRRTQAIRQSRAFDIGDEVVAGGMVGRVVHIGDGEVDVEVADGVNITFVQQAVQSRAAYNAGPASRGMGGYGARTMGSTGSMSGSRPANTSSRNSYRSQSSGAQSSAAWPDEDDDDDGPVIDEDANGAAGAYEDDGVDDVNAGGDGVEPSGDER